MAVLDTYALTTLANAKDHLDIPALNTDFDDRITSMINQASARIEAYLDRKILKRSYTEYRDGNRSNRLTLRNFPSDKPTELWIDTSHAFTDVNNQLALTEYDVDSVGSLQLLERVFPKGIRVLKIVYEAGFDTVPYDIENACLFLVEWYYNKQSDKSIAQDSKGKNGENVKFLTQWPQWLTDQLEPYRREDFALGDLATENY